MLGFNDETEEIKGRNTERMNFRTKAPIKAAIQHAAALSGVDDSTFTMSAALREAERVIEAHEHTRLEAVDHAAFTAALETPPDPNEALVTAAKRYKTRVTSR
ncbi:hypothetical protein PsW64_03722 [Pseudovibrio sp. W64]|uniref:type II toxin-antitoxin system TacA family antitoxin n=1 Tax=unclassified Pseudovibrio TaxID=2627060 RepID=UPI0007AE7767|nr:MULTISPECIES: DUF1778 domain-containing protein [unclassified Pseudovibrio]KZK78084.1 hypothetical protein PsW64_03722 [Pseudovibrio sp. W64]KZK96755.1 hypothetical protein PsAD26_05727 [Pseudovibrio sp. Ad26]KZK99659.1 hypothetical protein PsAD5_01300 [Pseudovibrio sp. Ad5]KZL12991.1 hypothetical protein PsAD37_05486 [Pseudovibrio sp. Ad37]